MKWLMNRIATPCCFSRSTISNRRSTSRLEIVEVGSSMTSTRASSESARTISIAWRSAMPSILTGRRDIDLEPQPREQLLAPGCASRPSRCGRHRARLAADEDVLGNREVGENRRVLMDHRDAVALRVGRTVDRDRRWPSIRISAAVRLVDAGQDLDERALAGTVLAGQRMDPPAVQAEIDVGQHLDRPEPLA